MNNNISGKIARKLAGFAIAALVTFGVFAITPATAKADSAQVQASADYNNVSSAAASDFWFYLSFDAQNELSIAQKDLKAGNYAGEITSLNDVISILKLGKPLAEIKTSTAAPEPSTMLLIACGLLGLGLFARRKATA
jgi:hypothetical protein